MTSLKTGFLLPRSSVYPAIGHDFLQGVKSCLASAVDPADMPSMVTHNIGFGTDEAEIYARNEQLLLSDGVDVVVAFMDSRGAEMIQPLFAATGKILLLVNMGAHYSYESAPGACTLCHTLDVAFGAWMTGRLAAAEGHRQAIFATSYYDGGYLQCFAMATRYHGDGEARIVRNFVSHFKPSEFSVRPIEEWLAADPSLDTLLCLFSGDVSPAFYAGLSRLQAERALKLYVSPMMLDDTLQPLLGEGFRIRDVKGHTAWTTQLDNPENRSFIERFEADCGRRASMFGMLGWETGTLLQQIARLRQAGASGSRLVQEVIKLKLASPRGWLRFDAERQQSYGPLFRLSVGDGFRLSLDEVLEELDDERQAFSRATPVGESSGWRNTYLCS